MKLFKRISILVLASLLAIGTARFCHHHTRGFRLTKIHNNLYGEHGEIGCPHEMLSQRFYYYNRGLQSFAFLSEDGQYILKIFNNKYQRRIALYDLLTHIPFCGNWARSHSHLQQQKLEHTFASYHIAATELQTETALLYAHLQKTHTLPKSLTLIDNLNIAHEVDPNGLGFVIQKKATMAYSELKALIDSGNIPLAQERIASLIDLLLSRCQKGIADNDPLIRTNFGFIGNMAVEVDVGPFSKDPNRSHPEIYQPELMRITRSLKHWLDEHEPSLVAFLEQQLQERVFSPHEMD